MFFKRMLFIPVVLLWSTGGFAISIREVLGDELKKDHPGETKLSLSNKKIDKWDGIADVAHRYPDLEELNLSHNELEE